MLPFVPLELLHPAQEHGEPTGEKGKGERGEVKGSIKIEVNSNSSVQSTQLP